MEHSFRKCTNLVNQSPAAVNFKSSRIHLNIVKQAFVTNLQDADQSDVVSDSDGDDGVSLGGGQMSEAGRDCSVSVQNQGPLHTSQVSQS